MKKIIAISLLVLFNQISFSQNKPFEGNGKIISKYYDYSNFNRLEFKDLDGNIEVEVGKPFEVSVTIDENLFDLLEVSINEKVLSIYFKGNKYNKLYIENTNIKIKVSLPEIIGLEHTGNSDLVVNNIKGSIFLIEQKGNGDVTIKGNIDELVIRRYGNGDIDAKNLITKKANVKSTGNGDVILNVNDALEAITIGNGDIINKGDADFDSPSMSVGNGDLIRKDSKENKSW